MSKWEQYYHECSLGAALPPWDSGKPCSQLLKNLDDRTGVAAEHDGKAASKCQTKPNNVATSTGQRQGTFLDIGCGTGASVCEMALRGWRAVGVDISPKAVSLAKQRWRLMSKRVNPNTACQYPSSPRIDPEFVQSDFFAWSEQASACNTPTATAEGLAPQVAATGADMTKKFDVVLDCQFFHAMWNGSNGRDVAAAIARCVADRGFLVVLCGNADDARDAGPTRLTAIDVLDSFVGCGTANNLQLISLEKSYFDMTPAYRKLGDQGPPMAWHAVFLKNNTQ